MTNVCRKVFHFAEVLRLAMCKTSKSCRSFEMLQKEHRGPYKHAKYFTLIGAGGRPRLGSGHLDRQPSDVRAGASAPAVLRKLRLRESERLSQALLVQA